MRNTAATAALLAAAVLAACQDAGTAARPDAPANRAPTEEASFASGPLRTGWIVGRDGRPTEVAYQVREGLAIWEGDIVLGEVDEIASTREELERPEGPSYGVIRDGSNVRWPGGVVPYVIDSNLPQPSRVTGAMKHIETNTGRVTFVPRTNQRDYVRFVRSNGCASSVGMVGGAQLVYLADGCSTGNTVHEISHALGMYHEHTRCDRDSYVQILLQNVAKGYESQFADQCSGASDVYAYDEGSIMHYGPYAFSANGLPTIVSLRGLDRQMGQRSGLSSIDGRTIDYMYP